MTIADGLKLPCGWVETTLGDAFSWGSGGTPRSGEVQYYGGGIPWVVIGDLNDSTVTTTRTTITDLGLMNSSAKWVEPGSILLAMYGSIGKLGIAGRRLTTNQAIAFTDPAPIDAKYLFWYLRYSRDDLIATGKGGTQQNISQTVIKAFPFLLAPLPEQRRIVAAVEQQFSRLDAAVAALQRARANLKRYRASVLKAACEGRLVPTEAELARAEGRDYEPADVLLQRILAERRAKWEADELAKMQAKGKAPKDDRWKAKYDEPEAPDLADPPEVPEGWALASMDQITYRITSGSRDWSNYYGRGSGTFLMAQNVRPGHLDLTFKQLVDPPEDDRDRLRSQVEQGDLLVTIVGANTGDVCRVPMTLPEHYVCQSVALMRLVAVDVAPFLCYYMVSYDHGQRQYRRYIYGAGRPHLSFDQLRMTPVLIPPATEQNRIVQEVERRLSLVADIDAIIDHNLKRAERLRQSILKRAFEGKLVPQDPNDEPAGVLLERIRAEREQSGGRANGKVKAKTRGRRGPAQLTMPLAGEGES